MKKMCGGFENMRFSKKGVGLKVMLLFLSLLLGTVAVSASEKKRMSVNVPLANIRSGPGTEFNILWKVEKFHPVSVVETRGQWCRFFDFEGEEGWILRSLLSTVETVIVKNDISNVRTGPGTEHSVVFRTEKGVPYKVLKHQDSWINVLHLDGDTGWIENSLVW